MLKMAFWNFIVALTTVLNLIVISTNLFFNGYLGVILEILGEILDIKN